MDKPSPQLSTRLNKLPNQARNVPQCTIHLIRHVVRHDDVEALQPVRGLDKCKDFALDLIIMRPQTTLQFKAIMKHVRGPVCLVHRVEHIVLGLQRNDGLVAQNHHVRATNVLVLRTRK